jgi:uncharacterized protein YndB with AHSA1/START domain
MDKAIITADKDGVIAEIDIAAPPGRVFEALIDPDQLMRWFRSELPGEVLEDGCAGGRRI